MEAKTGTDARCEWSRHHGKLWLAFSANGKRYEIAFSKDRFVDGMILFNEESSPALVKGMLAPESFMEGLSTMCPDADLEVERHQAKVKLEMGISLDRLRPDEVDPEYPRDIV